MEAINDSAKLIAQAIERLEEFSFNNEVDKKDHQYAIDLLKTALDKLVVEI